MSSHHNNQPYSSPEFRRTMLMIRKTAGLSGPICGVATLPVWPPPPPPPVFNFYTGGESGGWGGEVWSSGICSFHGGCREAYHGDGGSSTYHGGGDGCGSVGAYHGGINAIGMMVLFLFLPLAISIQIMAPPWVVIHPRVVQWIFSAFTRAPSIAAATAFILTSAATTAFVPSFISNATYIFTLSSSSSLLPPQLIQMLVSHPLCITNPKLGGIKLN